MSFQITVLKVLAGSPGGYLPLADLRHDVAILISSGRDWTDRTTRLAARAPGLSIFSQAFVLRDPTGWRITAAGREFLASIETPAPPAIEEAPVVADPPVAATPEPVVGVNVRRSLRRRFGRRGPKYRGGLIA